MTVARGVSIPSTSWFQITFKTKVIFSTVIGFVGLGGLTAAGFLLKNNALSFTWFPRLISPRYSWGMEEIIKCYCPILAIPGVAYEGYSYGFNRKGLSSFAFHSISMLSYYFGGYYWMPLFMAAHLYVNIQFERGSDVWEGFVSRYAQGVRGGSESLVVDLPVNTTLEPYTSKAESCPKSFRGEISVELANQKTTPEIALQVIPEEGKNLMWPVLITNGLLWQPANNGKNLLLAALWRTHNDPFVGFPKPEERHANWLELQPTFSRIFSYSVNQLLSVQQCAALMGKRGNRILAANEKVIRGDLNAMTKQITLKWNETLPVDKDCNGIFTMKPRAIINLDPRLHAMMSPWSRAMTSVAHELFDGKPYEVGGFVVRIYFAAGYDQEKLTEIGNSLSGPDTVIAVSGDDSVVGWGAFNPEIPFSEADQSKFDHTQDEGPLSLSLHWMKELGAPDWFLDAVCFCCRAPYTMQKHFMRARGHAGTQMPTGITLTTLLNSMATTAMYIHTIQKNEKDLVKSARDLGFAVKLKNTQDLHQITFLKGWWMPTCSGFCAWLPLPSAVVKLGKLLKSPEQIAKTKDSKKALRIVSKAMANSYGNVPFNYPILGVFLKTLSKFGLQGTPVVIDGISESWKPKVVLSVDLNITMCKTAFFERYGFEDQDLVRIEKLLNTVNHLPAYIEDPVFLTLSQTDY
jgi:hypothetical protein